MRSELDRAVPRIAAAAVIGMLVLAVGMILGAVPAAGAAEFRLDRVLAAHVSFAGLQGAQFLGAALEPAGGCVLVVLIAAAVWWRQDRRQVVRFVAVAVIGWLSVEPVKLLVQRPRPALPGVHAAAESWSFPSGHVALVTAVVLALVVVTTGRSRIVALIVGAGVVLVVASSRLVLEVHYPSDTVASVIWVSVVTVAVSSALGIVDTARGVRATAQAGVPRR